MTAAAKSRVSATGEAANASKITSVQLRGGVAIWHIFRRLRPEKTFGPDVGPDGVVHDFNNPSAQKPAYRNAPHVREQELVMVGEIPVEHSGPTHSRCFTWIGGVDLTYGSTADQGRTGSEVSSSRLWRPARALGTHAKRGPSTGHSAVGLRQAGKCLLTPRPHFTAPSCTLGNQVVCASDGSPFVRSAVRLVSAELPGPVAVCLPKRALCEL
jgi:hypothetical protein